MLIPGTELEPLPAGGWTDQEIETFGRRVGVFTKDGLSDMDAERLAETMLNRDRPDSGDDRRVCFECKGLVIKGTRKGVCDFAERLGLRGGFKPVRTVLQRCDGFQLRGA